MKTEEVSDRFVAPCLVNGLEAYDGEINLGVEENISQTKEDDVEPGMIFGRSFLRMTKEITDFGAETITIYPDIDPFLEKTKEEEKSNDDWDHLLDFNIYDIPLLGEEGLTPFICKMGKRTSSSAGGHLTQEEAAKEALAIRMSQKFALLEEERPIIETMAYHDKYKKILDEVWKDKVELDGKIVKEEEEAVKRIKGEALKEKDDPGAFIFPIRLEGHVNKNALADTGSDINTMPFRIYVQLGREDTKKVDRGITMINHTQAEALGILYKWSLSNWVTPLMLRLLILDISIDRDSPIVVGRGFLRTIGGIVNTPERLFSTFDGFCHQTFHAARSDVLRNAESDSDDEEDYKIKTERSLAIETTMGTHDDEAGSSRSKRSRQHETVEEIDDMLRIRLCEAGSDEEIFTLVAWIRAFNINEPIYVELFAQFYSTYEFDEVCADDELQTKKIIKFRLGGCAHSLTLLEFARRLGLYQVVKLEEEGFNVYFEGGLHSDEHFNAQDYWLRISREENLGLSRSHTSTIKKPILRVIHKMITYGMCQRTTGYDKIQKNNLWLLSMFDARHQNGVLTEDVVRSLSSPIYYRDLDMITLRDLIDSDGKLIPEDPQPGVPRGAYNPPKYAQPQYDQYYQQYPPPPLQYPPQVMDPNSSLGKICLGEDVVVISSDKVEGSGDWNSLEFQDTANSGQKKAMVFYQMDTEEVSNSYAWNIKLKEEKIVKKELIVAVRGEIYFVKFIINLEEDDVEPGVIFGRSFLRLTKAITDFGAKTVTIYPDIDLILEETKEERKINDDWDHLLDFNIDDVPLLDEEGLPPFVCKMGKSSRNKKRAMENLNYFYEDIGTSSSAGGHLTQEEATKKAIAIRMSQKFALLEEERPIIETMAYNDKYKKILDEVWKDKVELDGKIVKEYEEAVKWIKGEALKEKDEPGAFIFPIRLEEVNENALVDTGSDINTMPFRIYVGVTTLIAKFLILDILIDRDSPIVVGRGFLRTIGGIVNTPKRLFSTFDGFCHQTFRAARSDVMRNAESDSNDEEEYQIKRNKFGSLIYGPKPAPYLSFSFLGSLPMPLKQVNWKPDYKGSYTKEEEATRQWRTEIRLTDPYGNIYLQGFTTKKMDRKLSKYHKLNYGNKTDNEAGSSRSKRSRHETVEVVSLPQVHHEFLLWEGCSRDAKIGCDGEIDDMLRIRLREAGSDEEIFNLVDWIRAFNINELIYAKLCHEFYSTCEFDELCADDELLSKKIIKFRLGGRAHSLTLLEFARRLGLYQAVELEEEGFNVYFEGGLRSDDNFNAQDYWSTGDLDTITLRDLIDSDGKLIPEDPKPRVPRVGVPRPPRASIVPMQGAYNPPGYAQPQYDQYYQQYPPPPQQYPPQYQQQ
ncbi:hypothetical protein Tco_0794889 [Tanacetum coccineum]